MTIRQVGGGLKLDKFATLCFRIGAWGMGNWAWGMGHGGLEYQYYPLPIRIYTD
ncbi:MAG: hypothetical protein ACFKPT_06860 [Gloeotrichia echinulata GP01]